MKKIITLFKRDMSSRDKKVINEVNPGAEWVIEGKGIATRKWDGTCCMVQDGKFYKRYDAKAGKTPPVGFIPAQEPDKVTGHHPGWLLVDQNDPADKYHMEAWNAHCELVKLGYEKPLEDGTYELCGPKINGGNETRFGDHVLIKHGEHVYSNVPTEFEALKRWLAPRNIEGIVWHSPSGEMVKIKKKDFKDINPSGEVWM
jgi:hypothetical protein